MLCESFVALDVRLFHPAPSFYFSAGGLGQHNQNRAQPAPHQSNFSGTSYVDEVPIPNSNHGRQGKRGKYKDFMLAS